MMLVVFVALLLALVLGYFGRRWMAMTCLFACFLAAVGVFLWEIYSPEYGFSMPWIQTQLDDFWPVSTVIGA